MCIELSGTSKLRLFWASGARGVNFTGQKVGMKSDETPFNELNKNHGENWYDTSNRQQKRSTYTSERQIGIRLFAKHHKVVLVKVIKKIRRFHWLRSISMRFNQNLANIPAENPVFVRIPFTLPKQSKL